VTEGVVHGGAFSADAKALAAGDSVGFGGGVVVWDAATRQRQSAPLAVTEGQVHSVAFSADGKALAAGHSGGGVVVWDAATRQRLVAPLPVTEGDVNSVAFSADGKALAAGYFFMVGGGVALWDVDLGSWPRLAGQIANRNFTRDEWGQYFPDEPYRRTFRSLPWPADLSDGERKAAEAWEREHPEEQEARR
jgi:WD40 repeat protein